MTDRTRFLATFRGLVLVTGVFALLLIGVACSGSTGEGETSTEAQPSGASSLSPSAAGGTTEGTQFIAEKPTAVGVISESSIDNENLPLALRDTDTLTSTQIGSPAKSEPLTTSSIQTEPIVQSNTAVAAPVAIAVPARKIGYKVGEQAPDFTLFSVDGKIHTISDATASGKSVLLYFFASW